jgi:hypothetical protein
MIMSLVGVLVDDLELEPHGARTDDDRLVGVAAGLVGPPEHVDAVHRKVDALEVGKAWLSEHGLRVRVHGHDLFPVLLQELCHPVGRAERVVAETHDRPGAALLEDPSDRLVASPAVVHTGSISDPDAAAL